MAQRAHTLPVINDEGRQCVSVFTYGGCDLAPCEATAPTNWLGLLCDGNRRAYADLRAFLDAPSAVD